MSYLKLSWAFSNGVSASGMVLAIHRSFSLTYPSFASPKMSGLSVTYSGYWHPPTPDIIPPDNHKPKISTVCPLIPKGLTILELQRNSMLHQQRSMELSSLKKMMKERKEVPYSIPKRVAKYGVQIKRPNSIQVWVHFLLLPRTFYLP